MTGIRDILKAAVKKTLRWLSPELGAAVRSEVGRLRGYEEYFEEAERRDFFRRAFHALRFNGIDGDYAEFGCCGGITFEMAYRESRRNGLNCKLWAFDSFCGLPSQKLPADEHPRWIENTMRMDLGMFHACLKGKGIPTSAYEVIPGYYDVTLAPEVPNYPFPSNICLAYLDCDLYSSALAVLKFLLPRLKHGMIVAFDDWYCYSSTQPSGERRACNEVLGGHVDWRLVPYIQYGWHGQSFVVESRRVEGEISFTY